MTRAAFLSILIIICLAGRLGGQEVVTGLQSEPVIKNHPDWSSSVKGTADTLNLPFFDDFSGTDIFPDSRRWSDNYVFINNTYTNRQITTGVATFDAIDNTGRLYEDATSTPFIADYLTSKPVNLNYPASDNIWLTFFYESGGLGDSPEATDSLAVEFFAPSESKWYRVWSKPGSPSPGFRAGYIKISGSRYLKKGFRFRFLNYASLSPNLTEPSIVSNCDQWNIDYVVLGRNRSAADTMFTDVAFRYPFRSLLKTHEAMPWKQFGQVYLQEMGSYIPIHYRNNDVIQRNVTRNFEIRDVYKNSVVKTFSAGATNIDPQTNVDYNAGLIYTFSSDNSDSALFRIKSWLITDVFDPKANDTVVYYQRFSNYFAFDDGSAEAGYGINGLGSRNAMVAFRFRSYMKDTLRAIRICFNDSYLNSNQRAFDLMIWDDIDGLPGNVLYSEPEVMVEQGNKINGFYTYLLPEAVPVNGIFYVGWKQRTETFLNAGLDLNTSNGGKQYYWINGNWNQSQVGGTVMIRPVVGGPIATGINDIKYNNTPKLKFHPNPAKNIIMINPQEAQAEGKAYISITDLQGRELIRVKLTETIDISTLHNGVYIILLIRNGVPSGYNRLIKVS